MAFLAKICFKKSITKNFFYPKLSYTLCWQSKSLSLICVCTNKLLIKLIIQHACLLGDRKLLILSTTLLRFTFFVNPDIGLRPFIVSPQVPQHTVSVCCGCKGAFSTINVEEFPRNWSFISSLAYQPSYLELLKTEDKKII